MRSKVILLSCFLFSSCAFSNDNNFKSTESVDLNGNTISLNSESCVIKYSGIEKPLDINGKCSFAKKYEQSDVETFYFEDIQSTVALIIGNSIIDNPDYPMTLKRDDCGDSLVAVVVDKNNNVKLNTSEGSSVHCAGLGGDEPLYWVLSHDK